MAKSANNLFWELPDFRNDISDSSSEDSYDVYKNMQKIPDVPMPSFKKPAVGKNLFARKSPSVLRVRRSAILNSLGHRKPMVASTPMNPASASVASPENSLLQLSPIVGTSKDVDDGAEHARDDFNIRNTDKPVKDNKSTFRKSKSYDNLSKEKYMKHINTSVRIVVDHLQNLSDNLRKKSKALQDNDGRKRDQIKKHGSKKKNKDAALAPNEPKNKIAKGQPTNERNNENDLAGIEALSTSSDSDVVSQGAKSPLNFCRHPNVPVRRTVLMERQTQTTDSLEKVFKKNSALPSPLKEMEAAEREGPSAKRKIIESQEISSNIVKKSKTALNQLPDDKNNNQSNRTEKYTHKRQEQDVQGQKFRRETNLVPVDADVQSSTTNFNNVGMHDSIENMAESLLTSFDAKKSIASIISVLSSTSEAIDDKSLNNSKKSVVNTASSPVAYTAEESFSTANPNKETVAYNAPNTVDSANNSEVAQTSEKKDQTYNSQNLEKDLCSHSRVSLVSTSRIKNVKTKPVIDSSKISNPAGNTKGKNSRSQDSEMASQMDTVTRKQGRPKGSKNKKPRLTSITKKPGRTKDTGVLQSDQIRKSINKRRPGRPKTVNCKPVVLQPYFVDKLPGSRKTGESTTSAQKVNDCELSHDSETYNVTRKRGRPKGSKIRITLAVPTTKKSGRMKAAGVHPQSDGISESVNKIQSAKPINAKRKTILMKPYFVDRLSGFYQVPHTSSNPVQNNEENSDDENETKRRRQPPKRYMQSMYIDAKLMRKSLKPQSKKSVTEKSRTKLQQKNDKTLPTAATTSVAEDYNSNQLTHTNADESSTTSSTNKSGVEPTVMVEPLDSVKNKSISIRKNNNQTIENKLTDNTSDMVCSLPKAILVPETTFGIDSGVGASVPKETFIHKPSTCPSVIVHENISIPSSSSAGSQTSKVSTRSRKKSVTFTEFPIQIEKNQHTVVQAVSCTNTEAGTNDALGLVDSIWTAEQINDDDFETILPEGQTTNKTGDKANILHTVVNDEVIALNWICRPPDINEELSVNRIKVIYHLRNLKSACGVSSWGHIIVPPKFQKPWQISKKHCFTFMVQKGEALVKVQRKEEVVRAGSSFYIPLGAEYTLLNQKNEPLVLIFNKISQ